MFTSGRSPFLITRAGESTLVYDLTIIHSIDDTPRVQVRMRRIRAGILISDRHRYIGISAFRESRVLVFPNIAPERRIN